MSRVTLPCPRCQATLSIWSRPIIDRDSSPGDYQAFLADELNPKSCSSCGLPVNAPTPTVISTPHWVGVILENPDPIPATLALEIVATLTRDLGVVDAEPGRPVIMVSRSEELRRIISSKPNDRFCSIPLAKLLLRNFSQFVGKFNDLADAFLAADQPERAYWTLSEAVGALNELYFQVELSDLLEISALAAGDRVAEDLRVPQTAQENLAFMRSELEPYRLRQPIPTWCYSTYLCFYERGPHPVWEHGTPDFQWSTIVDLLSLDAEGSLDLPQAERHQIAIPMMGIAQQEPTAAEKALLLTLYLVMSSDAADRLGQLPEDVQSASHWAKLSLSFRWKEMTADERTELEQVYRRLTGREFREDARL